MRYERMRQMHGLGDEDIDAFIRHVQVGSMLVALPSICAAVVTADPDDDPVIATAVIGGANVLCTLDRHLRNADVLAYCASNGIRILTDVELLRELRYPDPASNS